METCSNCGAAIAHDPRPAFCPSCGTRLPEARAPEPPSLADAADDASFADTTTGEQLLRMAQRSTTDEFLRDTLVALARARAARAAAQVAAPDDARAPAPEPAPDVAVHIPEASWSDAPAAEPPAAEPTIALVLDALCQRLHATPHGTGHLVDLVTLVASADGEIDPEELDVLRRILSALVDPNLRDEVIDQLIRASLASIQREGPEPRIQAIGAALAEAESAESALVVGAWVAYASFGLSPQERAMLESLAAASGVTSERLRELIRWVRQEVDPALR